MRNRTYKEAKQTFLNNSAAGVNKEVLISNYKDCVRLFESENNPAFNKMNKTEQYNYVNRLYKENPLYDDAKPMNNKTINKFNEQLSELLKQTINLDS